MSTVIKITDSLAISYEGDAYNACKRATRTDKATGEVTQYWEAFAYYGSLEPATRRMAREMADVGGELDLEQYIKLYRQACEVIQQAVGDRM